MKTLREVLIDADARRVAIGHFNISDLGALNAIFAGAQSLQLPVLIGVSEGEREFIGVKQAAALIKSIRDTYDYPIFLNADHTHSLDKAKEAAEAGFDEIIFDNSSLPMEQNIANTKEAVAAIRAINSNIIIEGEIGYIGSSSEIIDTRPEASLTMSTPEEAVAFVSATGVDVLAPAVGNMHGLLKSMVSGETHKKLNIELIGQLKAAIANTNAKFMTLHGGSGTEDADFTAAAKSGMTIIHVSSELRLAWRRGVEEGLKDPNEIAPYKLVAPSVVGIQKIVIDRLKLFNGIN
jgi:fructose-bisphosphate aldolase, class II